MISKWNWVYIIQGPTVEYGVTKKVYSEVEARERFLERLIGRIAETEQKITEERTGWVNIEGRNVPYVATPRIFNTKEDALTNAKANGYTPVATVEIKWQE